MHRLFNALEPDTEIPIHHHGTKDETFIILRGRVRVNIYNDRGEVTQSTVLCHEEGNLGWHTERLVVQDGGLGPGSVIFEVKEGPFVAHEVDGILHV